jgi:hypothetical protein
MTKLEVFCFYDGSYSVCLDGKVQSQGHWSKVIAEQLQAVGHNPEDAQVTLANGFRAQFEQSKDKSWRCKVVVGRDPNGVKILSPIRRKNGKSRLE